MSRLRTARLGTLAAMALAAPIALAGCADDGASGGAAGVGVPAGAGIEEFKAAFAEIDPIELNTQTPAPKGSATGLPMERYFEAVTEWSDGKITWNVQYSNAVADPGDAHNALIDGRLDMASVLPIYAPSEFPASNDLIFGGFISDQSALQGALSSNAWPNEVAFDSPEIMDEFEERGLVPLLPVYNSGSNGLFCAEERTTLEEIAGTTVASGGVAQSAQVDALGGSSSSVPYTEMYESLQRGVVDCAVSSPTVSVLGGYVSETPNVVIDPDAGFALAPGTLAMNKVMWDGLPLAAQQLLWDKLDIFISSNIEDKIFVNNAEMATRVKEAGGQVGPFSDDAREALIRTNAELLDDLRGSDSVADGTALVAAMEGANEAWQQTVSDLGYESVPYIDFDTWLADSDTDLNDYTDAVMEQIFDEHRPS